nr:poly-beta-1,6 N-acetyl-D-glucosamine export porin PgaA [Methylomarinum sp. Ch1-1]MDP4519210.1 poly-beta-1,6 N-acetyl-D-glucosamine export porin PgaA [Methylomarinum sp. Ch1-1]
MQFNLHFFAQSVYAAAPDGVDHRYQEAIRIAREGKAEQALPILAELAEQFPQTKHYQHDYILVLFWAGKEAEIVEQANRCDINDAPLYVLESVAHAARNQQQFGLAERTFRLMARRDPANLSYRLGLARVLIDQRKLLPAQELLQSLAKQYYQHADFLLVKAYLKETEGDFLAAASLYQTVLQRRPGHKAAIRGLVFAMSRVKAFELAYRNAEQHRQFFSEEEWGRLRWDLAAAWVRWGEIYPSEEEALRFREIDKAIGLIEDNLAYLDRVTLRDSSFWRSRARFDMMVALRDRKRMEDVVELHRILREEQVEIPAYATIAAADAFLYLQQPEQARDLYLRVLEKMPGNHNAGQSLVFAYLEAEQLDAAERLAEQLAKQQPDKIWYKHPKGMGLLYPEGNHQKTEAELATVMIANFTDRLEEAYQKIQNLYQNASFNADIRDVRAHTLYYRGWPRQAREQYIAALNIAPKHLGLRTGLSETLHELREYPQEEANTLSLYALYPEEKNVQRQKRLWDIHNERELQIFSDGGFSTGSAQGSESIVLDSFLYSQPLDYHYRLFSHVRWMTGKFGAGEDTQTGQNLSTRGYYRRYGLGLEYAIPDLLAIGELHYDNFARSTVGFWGSLNYQFDDHWSAAIAFDTRSDEIGLRALSVGRLSPPQAGSTRPTTDGVTAYSVKAMTSYRVHESRRFDLAYQFFDYSDGNVSGVLSATWFERWISGPRYKLATYLNLGSTFHSRMDGNYYHPKNDFGSSLTLDNDLLTYRFYDLSFHQRLAFTIGQYWQKEKMTTANRYHWDPVGSIQYEHRWKARDRYELVYGGIRGYPIYDGNREETWRFYLNLNVRF